MRTTEPTIGCRRYGCHRNPRTGHCNRCGRDMHEVKNIHSLWPSREPATDVKDARRLGRELRS